MSDDDVPEGEADATEEQLVDAGELDSSEEGFIKGYSTDEEVIECDECGSAVPEGKKLVKNINNEERVFCSHNCAQEYEESLASEE